MSKNIVFEGWLTKSPPTKRIWRTKWRRRWFALRQSGDLPGQYFLDYYADRNGRRLKGTINLDLCEQVDAGLHMERSGNGSLDPKLRGSVFTIQTQSRTYHLEADCEAEMEKWVDAICRVCGLRPADEPATNSIDTQMTTRFQNRSTRSAMNDNFECADGTGPYIPISECITGVRAQEEQRAFTFDQKNIVRSTRTSFDRVGDNRSHQMYTSQPHIRLNNIEFSETESNMSDEECKSLNASQTSIREWPVGKSFTKLDISQRRNAVSEDGPPVPPRPPKTLAHSKEAVQKDTCQGPKVLDSIEMHENIGSQSMSARVPRRTTHGAPPSPGRTMLTPYGAPRYTDDEDDCSPGNLTKPIRAQVLRSRSYGAPPQQSRATQTPFGEPRYSNDEDDNSLGQLNEPIWALVPRRMSHSAPPSLGRPMQKPFGAPRYANDEDDNSPGQHGSVRIAWRTIWRQHGAARRRWRAVRRMLRQEDDYSPGYLSMQYSNLPSLPPAVDRALKPRHSSHSIGHINHLFGLSGLQIHDKMKADVLQYLDLDLHTSKPDPNKASDTLRMKIDIAHGKSMSAADADSAYKTVDFLKTEAFNITRQDAEASRNNHH